MSFLGHVEGKPVFHGRQRELDNLPLVEREVDIEDARPRQASFSLDTHGFQLIRHQTAVTDFLDPVQVRTIYRDELQALIVALTGADWAVALSSSVVRRSERAKRYALDGTTVPGRFAHCDYSPNAAGSRFWAESVLSEERLTACLQGRYAIYNIWRTFSKPPQDTPLAICDARTMRAEDCVFCDCVMDAEGKSDFRFENSVFRYCATQRWYYFSNMCRDEALVFKGFDSDVRQAGGVAHCAFDDPRCPTHAAGRESIDERVLACFTKAAV
jgi:hypothetical protein